VNGLPNVLNVSFPAWDAEEMVLALDREGIEAGTGSACSTGKTEPSHVLLAMGVPPDEAAGAIRFSLGRGNTNEDIDTVVNVLARLCGCS
jgi:cysteine desulfurase